VKDVSVHEGRRKQRVNRIAARMAEISDVLPQRLLLCAAPESLIEEEQKRHGEINQGKCQGIS